MSKELRVRKSIHALTPIERKSFFWCLKMLVILPAPSQFRNHRFYTIAHQTIRPKCIQDILLAGHNTGCEHGSIYFSYYHRHLCVLTELWLNYAHTILLSGYQGLREKYPESQYPQIYADTDQLWARIFMDYKQVNFPTVSLHYWNPSNYKEIEDMAIPPQLDKKRAESPDFMDQLMKRVRDHYPWEINIKTRLIEENKPIDHELIPKLLNQDDVYISKGQVEYSERQKELIQGKYNLRTKSSQSSEDHFNSFMLVSDKYFGTDQIGTCFQKVGQRNYQLYNKLIPNENGNTTDSYNEKLYIIGLQNDEMLVNYYSAEKNLHYISLEENKKYNYDNISQYNLKIPHYCLAKALFDSENTKFYNFIHSSDGIEKSHNIMHNNCGVFLQDYKNSPTNLLFYPYHSWIDMEIEIKLRTINGQDQITVKQPFQEHQQYKQFLNKIETEKNPKPISQKQRATKNRIEITNQDVIDYLKVELIDFTQSPFFKNQLTDFTLLGAYFIIEWIDPDFEGQLQNVKSSQIPSGKHVLTVACQARDLMMDPSNSSFRISKNLSEVYKKIYFKNYQNKYKSLGVGLDGKNFVDSLIIDFDYEVWDKEIFNERPLQLLKDDASNLPKYLAQLKKEITMTESFKKAKLRFLLHKSLAKPTATALSKETVFETSTNSQSQASGFSLERELNMITKDNFSRFITLTIEYPSNIKNGLFPLRIKINENMKKIFKEEFSSFPKLIDQLSKNGIIIYYISVFGKQQDAKTCIHCGDKKRIKIELNPFLYDSDPNLWKILHLYALDNESTSLNNLQGKLALQNEQYQSSITPLNKAISFETISNFDIKWLLGAQQVSIVLDFENNAMKLEPFATIRIEAHSYSNYTDQLKTISRKTSYDLKQNFFFVYLDSIFMSFTISITHPPNFSTILLIEKQKVGFQQTESKKNLNLISKTIKKK